MDAEQQWQRGKSDVVVPPVHIADGIYADRADDDASDQIGLGEKSTPWARGDLNPHVLADTGT